MLGIIGGLGEADSHAIQNWVSQRIEDQLRSRLNFAGAGLLELDTKKQEIINEMTIQEKRVSDI